MAIQPIGVQPNFTGKKAVTYKGNEYEKTNNGKLIGTGAGIALSGIMTTCTLKAFNKETVLQTLKNAYEGAKDALPQKSFDEYLKSMKKMSKVSCAVMSGLTVLLGLGIGALVDKNKNENRAFKADMAAKEAAKAE